MKFNAWCRTGLTFLLLFIAASGLTASVASAQDGTDKPTESRTVVSSKCKHSTRGLPGAAGYEDGSPRSQAMTACMRKHLQPRMSYCSKSVGAQGLTGAAHTKAMNDCMG